ncbi:MAG: hypothetical protein AAF587_41005 [Bacteroidota bacterium]
MKYIVVLSEQAEESINHIFRYHQDRKAGEGTDILSVIWDKIEALENNPKMYQIRYEDRRTAPVKMGSFSIILSTESKNQKSL